MKSECTQETLTFLGVFYLLEQIFIQCLNAFSDDYKTICKHHYPTIHNRGMSPSHLSSAFHRRLKAIVQAQGYSCEITLFSHDTEHQLYVFSLIIDDERIWMIYPQFLNAKTEAKTQIYAAIEALKKSDVLLLNDHLIVLCDHWFDRTRSSKELYFWWTGKMPEDNAMYTHQGIHNLISETTLDKQLNNLSMTCLNRSIYHPLESNQQHVLLKYFLRFSLFRYIHN